jgi:chemosensory pili system protein ChpA (sensor histidine kinase/response regulator)
MLEIFLEEFDSVSAQIRDSLGSWTDGAADEKASADIRRGFHTLKGSGRMVGATEIGDFAWRFEELLNKLIEGNVSFSEPLGETVTLAAGALGGLRARLTGDATELSSEHVNSRRRSARPGRAA